MSLGNADILQQLGVVRRINVAGTLTRLGGSLMEPEVLQAMLQAAHASVDIAELQTAGSQVIGRITGAEAGIVTSGAAAGLTLATAACLARWDVARMAALPDTRAMPNEVVMARTQRNSYDHAIRLAGAHIVDIGHNDRGTGAGIRGLEPWEIAAAITPQTVAMVFVATAQTVDELPAALEVMHAHQLPVIVDAAAQLPPRANLRRFIAAGADLVVFSGGKAVGGPQSSGILAGRRDLVGSALLQMMDMDVSPQSWSASALIDRAALRGIPHHGIGRGFKVGKEEIAGLLCALERFDVRDEAAATLGLTRRLQVIADGLQGAVGITPRLIPASASSPTPMLELDVGTGAQALVQRLLQGTPPVHVGERLVADGILSINPQTLRSEDDSVLLRSILNACRS
ncbi:MAG: aminotransferase class V-fold PLP-dependent enzyme [Burkholderiaceae bacterium]